MDIADNDKSCMFKLSLTGQTQHCDSILAQRDHLLIGISPFNSKFSPRYIESLIQWGASNFKKIDILLPDIESASLILQSAGNPLTKALKKTRKEINRHIRTIEAILIDFKKKSYEINLYKFSDFFNNPEYLKIKKMAEDNFVACHEFREACLQMAKQAIAGKLNSQNDELENIMISVPYIFTEIPFYINSPLLLGLESSVLVYHKPWIIGENLRTKSSKIKISDKQGHGIILSEVII